MVRSQTQGTEKGEAGGESYHINKHNIKTVHKPVEKNILVVKPVIDKPGLEFSGM
jgi:hypothetical protein